MTTQENRYYCHPDLHSPCRWSEKPIAGYSDVTDLSESEFVDFLSNRVLKKPLQPDAGNNRGKKHD